MDQIFLCYSPEDEKVVLKLYEKLKADGFNIWFDKDKLLPGQDWKCEVEKAIKNSKYVIVCLSHMFNNTTGYIQKQIKFILDLAEEQPESSIFVIPFRIEKCEVPERLNHLMYEDFDENGYNKLKQTMRQNIEYLSQKKPETDMEFLQSLSEVDLCELVILDLLKELKYENICYSHEVFENGNDVLCSKYNPLEGRKYYGFTIKNQRIDGTIYDSNIIREIHFQIKQALCVSFTNPYDGRRITLDHSYIISSFHISQNCIDNIYEELNEFKNQITFINGTKLLNLLSIHCPTLLSSLTDSKKRYIHLLFNRFLETRTISSFGSLREFTLPDIYTAGFISPTTIDEAKFFSFVRNEIQEGTTIVETYPKHRYIVFIADVGAGKTTLLQKFSLDLITHNDGSINTNPTLVPLFIELSTITKKDILSQDSFIDFINISIEDSINSTYKDIEKMSYLLMLDGFDEVQSDHQVLAQYIQYLPKIFKAGVFLTSRPSRIPYLSSPFQYFTINPFRDEDILAFLKKWFPEDDSHIDLLFERITNDITLLRFCRTPLLLTLFTALASKLNIDDVPTRLTDIYDSMTALLIGKWESIKKITNQFSPKIKNYCIEGIAYDTHCRGLKQFSKQSLIKIIDQVLHLEKGINSTHLFNELIYRSSLIRKNESGKYQFVHLSFQEFFCAKHLFRAGNLAKVQKLLFSEWWKNTLMFYFGLVTKMDDLRLIERKAEGKGHILIEYLYEAVYTSEKSRKLILKVMAKQLLSSNDLPEKVLNVCTQLESEIIPELLHLLTRYSSDVYTYNYYLFLLQLGRKGGNLANKSMHMLQLLRPDQTISLIKKISRRYLIFNSWHIFYKNLLKCYSEKITYHYTSLSNFEKKEIIPLLLDDLNLSINEIKEISNLNNKFRTDILKMIDKLIYRMKKLIQR